jgi:DNA-binding CsgD family transcriptional regulator
MGFAENLVWAARISAPMSGEQSEVADGSGLTALASLLSEVLATTAARTSGAELVDGAVRLYVTGVLGGDPARLREAASAFVAAGRPLLAAIANEDLGRALYVQGARQQAAEPLEAAWKQYCDAGATVEADRARRFLRTAGVRRGRKPRASAPRATHGWDALTDAERRVAELIAEGLSNREAAQRLHVSPNTVATHLRSVYTKLGVTKRVHLARMEQPTSLNP